MPPVSSVSTSEYCATETPSDGESGSQTAVVDENAAVQLGRRGESSLVRPCLDTSRKG